MDKYTKHDYKDTKDYQTNNDDEYKNHSNTKDSHNKLLMTTLTKGHHINQTITKDLFYISWQSYWTSQHEWFNTFEQIETIGAPAHWLSQN